jgi:hypothetical protein
MRQITTEQLTGLLAAHEPPCVSLYQPTHRHHPDNQQDPIRYRNLVAAAEASLREKYPTRQIRALMEQFQPLARDHAFWNHRTDGLAVFGSTATFEVFELQRPVREFVVVADSFHTKPLLRILQSADRYQILCLSRHEARLYEGNRDALDPVHLTDVPTAITEVLGDERRPTTQMIGTYGARGGGGGTAVHHGHGPRTDLFEADEHRFFRAVDRGILEHHSRPSGLPLMLAALPENQEPFRTISANPFLLNVGIMTNPDVLDANELRVQAWQKLEPLYLARLEMLKDNFHTAWARQAASGDLSDAARAAVAGQVRTVLIEADRVIPGILDRNTGAIRDADLASPHADDMLDDLAEIVLARGGEVVIVPAERMPTRSGLAAIYRFVDS